MKKLTNYLLALLLVVVVVTSGAGCTFLVPYVLFSEEETEEEYDYYDDYEGEIETTKKPIQKPVLETTEETTESTTKIPVTIMPNGDIFIGTIETTEATTARPTQAPTTQAPTVRPTPAPTTQAPTTAASSWQPGVGTRTYSELQSCSNISAEDLAYARSILASICNTGMTDMQKIKAVHDFLVKNTTYDYYYYSRPDSHDQLHNILYNQIGVCQGYAVAFYIFMNELGIPCTLMLGDALDNGTSVGHAWNAVKLDGYWYFVDVTWDDPVVNGSTTYPDGSNISYEYLLCTFDHIGITHTYDDYIGELPTPYGGSTIYNDQMFLASGINGLHRITSLDIVKQVGASVQNNCTYVFIIEGGGITVDDILSTFYEQIDGRIGGTIKYTNNDNVVTITFIKN